MRPSFTGEREPSPATSAVLHHQHAGHFRSTGITSVPVLRKWPGMVHQTTLPSIFCPEITASFVSQLWNCHRTEVLRVLVNSNVLEVGLVEDLIYNLSNSSLRSSEIISRNISLCKHERRWKNPQRYAAVFYSHLHSFSNFL